MMGMAGSWLVILWEISYPTWSLPFLLIPTKDVPDPDNS